MLPFFGLRGHAAARKAVRRRRNPNQADRFKVMDIAGISRESYPFFVFCSPVRSIISDADGGFEPTAFYACVSAFFFCVF
jgi:hypothetical protein